MTIISYVWVVSMYLSSIYLSLPDEPCWKPQLQQRRRTAEAESGLQNPQILWDQFTSPSSMAVIGLSQVQHLMSSLSLTVTQKRRNMTCKRDSPCPLLRRQMPRWPTKKQMKQSLSTAPPQSRLPSRVQSSRRKTTRAWKRTVAILAQDISAQSSP